ncbi:caspase family protein [Blastopirellula sp. JC732]|uniref:Caspase family protein n=1 Tax=Blastopirellula sediminis TaxID=2894196 RepID=A0A9X1SHX6_9BACT|nr:caspase family protein [Blastopirellula sediminis]MCC9606104.1 caspase family protein [Blastopirellula sediminis]MCC9630597.1 caspase family protein [Blastopirellula sediminis]
MFNPIPWRPMICSCLFLTVACCGVFAYGQDTTDVSSDRRYALLVGCTEYPDSQAFPTLRGPSNDVRIWRELLTGKEGEGFGFPEANVTVLTGKADDTEKSPTRRNILRKFDHLAEVADSNSHIFILLSGHGTQQPIADDQDPYDPENPEEDGYDEVFLPADARPGSGEIENALVDNVIGQKLDQIRAKGASVFVVFDCCFSGTMTRAIDGVEKSRFVPHDRTGIPAEKFAAAAAKVKAEVAQKEQLSADEEFVEASASGVGDLVAFFAAQPFECAVELPLPAGAENLPENCYSLLSYSLVQTLRQRRAPMSYRSLAHALSGQYRAARGSRFPTPFAQGSLDREVLGLMQWPIHGDLLLHAEDGEYSIAAGSLHGVTVGSILTVEDPIAGVVGHVKIAALQPAKSQVVPCGWEGAPAPTDPLPDGARCKLVYREYGDFRLKLFADDPMVVGLFPKLSEEVRAEISLSNNREDAPWSLRRVTPSEAVRWGLTKPTGDRILLVHGDAALPEDRSRDDETSAILHRVYGNYATDPEKLTGELNRDLPRLFAWENLWKVAGGSGTGGDAKQLVEVTTTLLASPTDTTGVVMNKSVINDGEVLSFVLKNDSPRNIWISAYYLDANMGIRQVIAPRQVRPRMSLRPLVLQLTTEGGGSIGQEGLIVFGDPVGDSKSAPNYDVLQQLPLSADGAIMRDVPSEPKSPMEALLATIATGSRFRGVGVQDGSAPTIVTQSWILVDKKKP